jgi:hypothetical protein
MTADIGTTAKTLRIQTSLNILDLIASPLAGIM